MKRDFLVAKKVSRGDQTARPSARKWVLMFFQAEGLL